MKEEELINELEKEKLKIDITKNEVYGLSLPFRVRLLGTNTKEDIGEINEVRNLLLSDETMGSELKLKLHSVVGNIENFIMFDGRNIELLEGHIESLIEICKKSWDIKNKRR